MQKGLILVLIFFSCSTHSRLSKNSDSKILDNNFDTSYKVYKIDSINSYYLIYAKKNDSIYKIVSKKVAIGNNDNRININSEYFFKLHSNLADAHIGNMKILPQNSLLVNCFYYDDSTSICLERDSINELYHADNVKGLYFIKE